MTINMNKIRKVEGSRIDSIIAPNGKVRGVAVIPADGFEALVGYCLSTGVWAWVRKDFRK